MRGTCRGDSGSPAFVLATPPDRPDLPEWMLLGILSTGVRGDGCGVGYYTNAASAVAWLESQTKLDLSPCTDDDGAWRPSPRCRRPALDASGGRRVDEELSSYSQLCGPPFHPTALDIAPPRITDLRVLTNEATRALDITVTATDEGWGIARVDLQLLDRADSPVHAESAERPPFRFAKVPFGSGAERLRVTVTDFAALHDERERAIVDDQPSPGCHAVPSLRANPRGCWIRCLFAVAVPAWLRRRSALRRARP